MVSGIPLFPWDRMMWEKADWVESTNDRVKLFSILIMVGVVGLGAWQVSLASSPTIGKKSSFRGFQEYMLIYSLSTCDHSSSASI